MRTWAGRPGPATVQTGAPRDPARIRTRFPPEPNGYLHIGHAKSICLNFGVARDFGGTCNLRFDDTNPTKEETEFVEAIIEDTRWLGIEWKEITYASDYFDLLYEWAQKLVMMGKAYVDDQSPEEVSANRGTFTEPGKNSPWRDRDVDVADFGGFRGAFGASSVAFDFDGDGDVDSQDFGAFRQRFGTAV